MIIEALALGYGAKRLYKHYKSRSDLRAAATSPLPSDPPSCNNTPPISSLPPQFLPTVREPVEEPVIGVNSTVAKVTGPTNPTSQFSCAESSDSSRLGEEPRACTWRPVYMLERSTSKSHMNEIRTHRALYVGDLPGAEGRGRAYEIRKVQTTSILGAFGGRKMNFTDAEEWTGPKAFDRQPVYLGETDWTDQELNSKGQAMVKDYPTYSLNYANCQHFVADLAKEIIPEDRLAPHAYDHVQPTFDKLIDDVQSGEYDGHGEAFIRGVAGLTLTYGKFAAKFFHFTKATMKSIGKLDWKPFEDHIRRLQNERLRQHNLVYGREQQTRMLKATSTGSSSRTHSSDSRRS